MKDDILTLEFYKTIFQSFFDNPVAKMVLAGLLSLFDVPLEFVLALPIFWFLDFCAGLYASRKRKEPFSIDKMRGQFVKITLHIGFLMGCVVMANAFGIDRIIYFGFGYIISNEFIFSTVPHLFGDKKAGEIAKKLKELLFDKLDV